MIGLFRIFVIKQLAGVPNKLATIVDLFRCSHLLCNALLGEAIHNLYLITSVLYLNWMKKYLDVTISSPSSAQHYRTQSASMIEVIHNLDLLFS